MLAGEHLSSLTRDALKAKLYERETHFRDGFTDAVEVLGDQFADTMKHAALLMIKPDGLVSGKAAAIVAFLERHGYAITAVETPVLHRLQWRELWRFQLTSATQDRLAVNDLVLRHEALLLLLRQGSGVSQIPASMRLSVLKGPSSVEDQPADCLRREIGQPNRVFSLFHVADEPADLLRELAILLDAPARRRVLASLRGMPLAEQDRERLQAAVGASSRSNRDLGASAAVECVRQAVRDAGAGTPALAYLQRELDRMHAGERIRWRPFAEALQSSGVVVDAWDVATLGANFIHYDEAGHAKQLVAVDPARWESAPAQPMPPS